MFFTILYCIARVSTMIYSSGQSSYTNYISTCGPSHTCNCFPTLSSCLSVTGHYITLQSNILCCYTISYVTYDYVITLLLQASVFRPIHLFSDFYLSVFLVVLSYLSYFQSICPFLFQSICLFTLFVYIFLVYLLVHQYISIHIS